MIKIVLYFVDNVVCIFLRNKHGVHKALFRCRFVGDYLFFKFLGCPQLFFVENFLIWFVLLIMRY